MFDTYIAHGHQDVLGSLLVTGQHLHQPRYVQVGGDGGPPEGRVGNARGGEDKGQEE